MTAPRDSPSPLDKPARTWQFDPRQFLGAGNRDRRHTKAVVRKTAGCNTDQMRSHRRGPEQRRPASAAEVTLLVVIVWVMKCVDGNFATSLSHARSKKVGRYSKSTARATFAIRAMANGMESRLTIDRNGCRSAGALSDACHSVGCFCSQLLGHGTAGFTGVVLLWKARTACPCRKRRACWRPARLEQRRQ
jgi:hypothetical protein